MSNSYLNRRATAGASNEHGRKNEQRNMKTVGARLTPGSGAMACCKSDGVSREFRYENKSTTAKSFGLKWDTLEKIRLEALETGLRPALTLSFVTGSGRAVQNGDFVVLTLDVFQDMLAIVEGRG